MKNREITKIMGTKFIVIAIICLLFIIGINYGLYRKIKGTFKERKLI